MNISDGAEKIQEIIPMSASQSRGPEEAEKENSFPGSDSLALCDVDRAFVEMVEKIEIDWPEFLPVERIRSGMTEIVFGLLLVVGLVALLCLSLALNLHGLASVEC